MADRIEHATSNSVLSFWFDGDWHDNYKRKWFATGDLQLEIDSIIYENFNDLFEAARESRLHFWLDEGPSGHLALIILLDQFSRHIFRHCKIPVDNEIRCATDALAIQISEKLISVPGWEKYLTVSQHVFALMPFRHNQNIARLRLALDSVDKRERNEKDSLELINKFRKQTVRRLQHLEDRAKAEATTEILERYPISTDESGILQEPLVHAVEKFLVTHGRRRIDGSFIPKSEHYPVSISLSGGVDSMVISKILNILKTKLGIKEIVAIHIDYANREESGREADYVDEWCSTLGFKCYKRIISEVTRGVTDRATYERVARDIRYGFYKEVLEAISCPAVIFGHHMGDVQENIISNIMRGCSPLDMSGMSETGLSSGVLVWRPLLQYSKDDIYAFAHKYGVPYFKDTTPSWSTRGKLRQHLVPLLIDMYGEGVLQNLTNLGRQSDEYRELVDAEIFRSFKRAVNQYPCGLSVNVFPFRSRPLCFWKEMLKEMMHSMGMSMIRDKAVVNFMERIQRPIHQVAGWLELRKGFHTHISAEGDLVVYRAGVLSENATIKRGFAPLRTELRSDSATSLSDASANWDSNTRVNIIDFIQNVRMSNDSPIGRYNNMHCVIGVWNIAIKVKNVHKEALDPFDHGFENSFYLYDENFLLNPLPNISSLLLGHFEYSVFVPLKYHRVCELVVYSDNLQSFNVSSRKKKSGVLPLANGGIIFPSSLAKIDLRLKEGLPLLIPNLSIEERAQDTNADNSNQGFVTLELKYSYNAGRPDMNK